MALNSSLYNRRFPINGRFPTNYDLISLYCATSTLSTRLKNSSLGSIRAEVYASNSPLNSSIYIDANGDSTITYIDIPHTTGDISTYKMTKSTTSVLTNVDIDEPVSPYVNATYYNRLYLKFKIKPEGGEILPTTHYSIGFFGADCSTFRTPSRYFVTLNNPRNTINGVNKDIASYLPTNIDGSIPYSRDKVEVWAGATEPLIIPPEETYLYSSNVLTTVDSSIID